MSQKCDFDAFSCDLKERTLFFDQYNSVVSVVVHPVSDANIKNKLLDSALINVKFSAQVNVITTNTTTAFKDQYYSSLITNTLYQILNDKKLETKAISISVNVLAKSDLFLVACFNAVMIALLHAGIPLICYYIAFPLLVDSCPYIIVKNNIQQKKILFMHPIFIDSEHYQNQLSKCSLDDVFVDAQKLFDRHNKNFRSYFASVANKIYNRVFLQNF